MKSSLSDGESFIEWVHRTLESDSTSSHVAPSPAGTDASAPAPELGNTRVDGVADAAVKDISTSLL